jgi:hypothetical protein
MSSRRAPVYAAINVTQGSAVSIDVSAAESRTGRGEHFLNLVQAIGRAFAFLAFKLREFNALAFEWIRHRRGK